MAYRTAIAGDTAAIGLLVAAVNHLPANDGCHHLSGKAPSVVGRIA